MNKTESVVIIVLFVAILLVLVYVLYPNVLSFLSRNNSIKSSISNVSVIKYDINPREIKTTDNATIELSLKNDGRRHKVQVILYSNEFIKIYLLSGDLLNSTRIKELNGFTYSFYLDPAFSEVSLNFVLKGSLNNLVNSADCTIVLDLFVDDSLLNRTWNNVTVTIRK